MITTETSPPAHRPLRLLAALAAIGLVAWVAPPASAGAVSTPLQCTLPIVGQEDDGTYITGTLTCTSRLEAARSSFGIQSVLATHYTGFNNTGSALTVTGGACGGTLNMPAGWVDVVSSTRSNCTVVHYDFFYQTGPSATTFAPGGNLTSFDNRTNSTQYL